MKRLLPAIATFSRTRKFTRLSPSLKQYLQEIAVYPVGTAKEEIKLTRGLEKAEIEYWKAILSYLPSAKQMLDVIEKEALDFSKQPDLSAMVELRRLLARYNKKGQLTKFQMSRWAKKCGQIAKELRTLDGDRFLVAQCADMARQLSHPTFAYKLYLNRIAKRNKSQLAIKNVFIRSNLRLVVAIVRSYNQLFEGALSTTDLIQEGNIGLIRALNRFDPHRNIRFVTYASYWIRQSIHMAVLDKGRTVRIPSGILKDCKRVSDAIQDLFAVTGHIPAPEEVMAKTNIPLDKLNDLLFLSGASSIPIDLQGKDKDEEYHIDFLQGDEPSPYDFTASRVRYRKICQAFDCLTPIELDIIEQRFGEKELSFQEIGNKYSRSRERIRQIQERALGKLRVVLRRNSFDQVA